MREPTHFQRYLLAIDRRLTEAAFLISGMLLAVISCLGLFQVVTRFVFEQPSTWTEEIMRRLLIWMVMLGCVAAFRQGALVSVDLMLRLSRGAWRKFVEVMITVSTLGFLAFLLWFGADLAWRVRFQTFASIDISMGWAYLSIPVGAAFGMLAVLAHHFDPKRLELETAQ